MVINRSIVISIFIISSLMLVSANVLAEDANIQDLQTDVTQTKSKADKNAEDIQSMKGGLPVLEERVSTVEGKVNTIETRLNSGEFKGEKGDPGPQGPQGEPGPEGPQGPAPTLNFAGQMCPEGQVVIGFDTVGNIVCSAMTPPICGDGNINGDEECDDGNTVGGDGCSSECSFEICGNGVVDALEQCDDGNNVDGDGCTYDCLIETSDVDPEPSPLTGITRAHNSYRANVGHQPLAWDSAIAVEAQAWADQLAISGTLQQNPNFGTFSSAENIAAGVYSATVVVDLWAAEIIYTTNGIYCPDYMKCGHYANIVNQNFTKVGCGNNGGYWVCNYSP